MLISASCLIRGAWIVAISQIFPLLQIIAGTAVLFTVSRLFESCDIEVCLVKTVAGGFTATMLTRSILIAIAAMIGKELEWMRVERHRRSISKGDISRQTAG